jgi:proteic killer suppression protein
MPEQHRDEVRLEGARRGNTITILERRAPWNRDLIGPDWTSVEVAQLRKLLILDAAETLDDLRVPPGNRLEKLKGNRAGSYSVRINQQWRICFRWTEAGLEDIEIVDCH